MCVVAVCVKLSYYLYLLHRPDVAPGTYVLSVIAHDHLFDKVRTQLSSSSRGPCSCLAYAAANRRAGEGHPARSATIHSWHAILSSVPRHITISHQSLCGTQAGLLHCVRGLQPRRNVQESYDDDDAHWWWHGICDAVYHGNFRPCHARNV